MTPAVIGGVFVVIFLGELPDKTMFATLFLASRGRPVAVWFGTAAAFTVHVVIAVAVGAGLFALIPHHGLDAVVAALFFAGAVYSYLLRNRGGEAHRLEVTGRASAGRVAVQAAVVIFIAEWGDLTQVLTANLAARYHRPLSVGVGAVTALWVVAALAGASGANLLRVVSVRTLRLAMAVVLLALAGVSAYQAVGT